VFTQQKAVALSQLPHLFLLCGHYEGIDQRILDTIIDEEISIGDYVLTGGELPAMVMVDAISRLVPGVLHNNVSAEFESLTAEITFGKMDWIFLRPMPTACYMVLF
jgi:tRNA (guanine37-N1)-methyltransferase